MSTKRKSLGTLESSGGSASDSDMADSDLKKLAKKRKKSHQKKAARSDASSSSSDSDSGDEGPTAASLKNSSEVEDGEVPESDSDIGEFDDGLDDELMGDAEDRKRLQLMTEKEREEEIFKRAEKREMLKKRYEIEKKLKLQKRSSGSGSNDNTVKGLDTKERSRVRKEAVENKKDKKTIALDVLKAKRKEKQEQQQKLEVEKKSEEEKGDEKKKWKANEIYSSDSSDDEVERARSRSPEKKRSSSSSSSASSRSRSPSPERQKTSNTISSKDDLEKIRLDRSKLERWCHLPFFDKVVTGCFVRIGIGENNENRRIYRVTEVTGVEEGPKVYTLGNTRTNKALLLRHAHQERLFRLEFASNDMFEDSEFKLWREETMMAGMYLPTVQEVEDKYKQIMQAEARTLNEKEIMHMVKEKERFQQNPRNYAMFKSRLAKDRDAAMAEGRHDDVNKLSSRLAEIEERAEDLDRKRSEKISSIALINDRNRKNNIKKAEVNIKQEMEKKRLEGETSDPFTRRKTKPMLATAAIRKAGQTQETSEKLQNTDIKPTLKSDPDVNKASEEKKENEPAKDLFSAHDFDIEINLDTFSHNSAIKMNLTPVVNTKKDIGPKKCLNLADYKKKRGLI